MCSSPACLTPASNFVEAPFLLRLLRILLLRLLLPTCAPSLCAAPRRWAHRVALRYRASLQTKQKLVHKFFDELEVEASGES